MAIRFNSKPHQSTAEWVQFDEDVSFLLERASNDAYIIAMGTYHRDLNRKDSAKLANGVTTESLKVAPTERTPLDVQSELFALHIIKGWKGEIYIDDSEIPEPYTPESAYKLLMQNPLIYIWVQQQAQLLDNKYYEQFEETVKKSQSDSSGNSNGGVVASNKRKSRNG